MSYLDRGTVISAKVVNRHTYAFMKNRKGNYIAVLCDRDIVLCTKKTYDEVKREFESFAFEPSGIPIGLDGKSKERYRV